MTDFVNVAAYRFVALDGLPELRESLRQTTRTLNLKGTILLSREGINLFVAGPNLAIDQFLESLSRRPEFHKLEVKRSPSGLQPFNRMLVKIKSEIISFGVPDVDPIRHAAPRISPALLKQWLDEKREVTLLDVRNIYEIEVGTFAGAVPAGIDHFRQFPQAVAALNLDPKTPLVMFCTGGIRCEKAAPFMLRNGFAEVYHLDGGILKYFEEVGGEHYTGECFVFDKRVALDPSLLEAETALCYACQSVLSPRDRQSQHYQPGHWCPHCYIDPDEQLRRLIDRRQRQIAQVTSPLPGSQPYDNIRPLNVAATFDGYQLIEFLAATHPQIQRTDWLKSIDEGRIQSNRRPLSATELLRGGQRMVHLIPQTVEPPVAVDIRVLFEDSSLIVVDKPAPLPVHPCGRFNRNTLVRILDLVYRPLFPRPQHRLDANTTGVVVLAKSRRIAAQLQAQFELKTIRKTYLAKVQGHPTPDAFTINQRISVRPRDGGRRVADESGVPCQTHIRVLSRIDDGTSLLLIHPLTGRTNQIRIHLWDFGHPIVGDPIYGVAEQEGVCQTMAPGDAPMCLHHLQMQIQHPANGTDTIFATDLPRWARGLVSVEQLIAVLNESSICVSDDTVAPSMRCD